MKSLPTNARPPLTQSTTTLRAARWRLGGLGFSPTLGLCLIANQPTPARHCIYSVFTSTNASPPKDATLKTSQASVVSKGEAIYTQINGITRQLRPR